MNKNKWIFWSMFFSMLTVASACDSKQSTDNEGKRHATTSAQKISEGTCDFSSPNELIGKNSKEFLSCFEDWGGALIGKDSMFLTVGLRRDKENFILLAKMEKGSEYVVLDAMRIPVLHKDENFIFGECFTDPKSRMADAVAIVKYGKEEDRFLIPKQTWLIDFKSGKFKLNKNTKVTCLNESFGE
jgi:hypothetical protein